VRAFCIYGPPGTGKTTELVRLINETLERNQGRGVVFLSHTKVAAREAVDRGACKLQDEHAMTLHSLCFKLCGLQRSQVVTRPKLVAFGEEIGMPITGESVESERDLTDADFMMAIYDLARNRMQQPDAAYEESDRPGTLEQFRYLVRSYESWKQNTGLMDFVDMLSAGLQVKKLPQYKAFFIDEAQDLSNLQWAVIHKVTGNASLLFAAGDDDQALFSFGGADARGMPKFEERFNAQRKVLDQSHRIPRSVHVLAESIIQRVSERVPKVYKPRDEEGEIERIPAFELIDYSRGVTVLYRDRSVRGPVEDFFKATLVPYRTRVGWPSPLQSKHGRAIMALYGRLRGGMPTSAYDDLLTDAGKQVMAGKEKQHPWSYLVNLPHRVSWYLDNVNLEAPVVALSSIHSFKGAEDDTVVVSTGMASRTYMGMSEKPDDEHRAYYVAVTRARHKLIITEGQNAYDL